MGYCPVCGMQMGSWAWGFWILVILLVSLLVVGTVLVLALRLSRSGGASDMGVEGGTGRGDDAIRILNERFARGEIDEEEYARRRSVLAGVGGTTSEDSG